MKHLLAIVFAILLAAGFGIAIYLRMHQQKTIAPESPQTKTPALIIHMPPESSVQAKSATAVGRDSNKSVLPGNASMPDTIAEGIAKGTGKKMSPSTARPLFELTAESPESIAPPVQEKIAQWNIIISDNELKIFPRRKWNRTFVQYPYHQEHNSKDNRQTVHPEFAGVVYKSVTNSEADIDGTSYNVVVETYTAAEASSKMPFSLSLSSNPEFIIFGDQDDTANRYLYRNHKLTSYRLSATEGKPVVQNLR